MDKRCKLCGGAGHVRLNGIDIATCTHCRGEGWEPDPLTNAIGRLAAIQCDTGVDTRDVIEWIRIARDAMSEVNECPCKLADKPCQPDCTCVNEASSKGCMCCARYGNDEQRKRAANWIVEHLRQATLEAVK